VEYNHLVLALTDEAAEMTIFAGGIALFTPDDDWVRPIQRVLCRVDQERGGIGSGGGDME
jgi:hypothetical protein